MYIYIGHLSNKGPRSVMLHSACLTPRIGRQPTVVELQMADAVVLRKRAGNTLTYISMLS